MTPAGTSAGISAAAPPLGPQPSLHPPTLSLPRSCVHCGLPVPSARGESAYCCQGCETVAAFLGASGQKADAARREGAEEPGWSPTGEAYEEFDDEGFHAQHVREAQGSCSATLYVEGTHCAACVWLVERLPRLCPGVVAARLDLSRGLAELRWDASAVALSEIARTLDRLGYRAHPYRAGEEASRRRAEDRAALVRLAIAGALAGNVMLISFATYGGILHGMESPYLALFRWIAFGLSLGSVFGPGRTFLRGALGSLRSRVPHVDLPVSIALLAGVGGGLVNTIRGAGEVYFDTVAVLVFLLLIGRWLQGRQRRRAAETSELLTALAPSRARRLEPQGARIVSLEGLLPGDRIEIRGGERVPADGVVVEGEGSVDRSLLTGEARPVAVSPGPPEAPVWVHAGAVCRAGRLVVRVEAAGQETRLAKILRQAQALSARKAPVVAWANRVAGTFVVTVLVLALLTFVGWSWAAPALALDHALALLIVTCPCALGLATPLAVDAALGRAARLGAVAKGGDVLQRLAGEATGARGPLALLDKTGTLSEGQFRLQTWDLAPGEDPDEVRARVLALEAASSHPIAEGFREAWDPETPASAPGAIQELPGGGLRADFAGESWALGSPRALSELGVELPQAELAEVVGRGETPVIVARGSEFVGLAGLGDRLREEAPQAVAALQREGWSVEILSGDHPELVAAVGASLGLQAQGGASPEDKAARVSAAQAAGYGPVLMVGDGVNDAAALAAADVGVGVRGGSIAALEAADVYLSAPGLAPLIALAELARQTLTRVRVNLALSLAYNLVAATLAAAGWIDPIVAAILMPLSSLAVVANSYRRA